MVYGVILFCLPFAVLYVLIKLFLSEDLVSSEREASDLEAELPCPAPKQPVVANEAG
jgi:hypothetical protein